MGYSDLLRAKRNAGTPPTLERRRWSEQQQARIKKGLCVKCGLQPSSANSYLCADCASRDTLEDIRAEIESARQKAKNG